MVRSLSGNLILLELGLIIVYGLINKAVVKKVRTKNGIRGFLERSFLLSACS